MRNRSRFFQRIYGVGRNCFNFLRKGEANMEKGSKITCECLKCGHTQETTGHCIDISCSKCGGNMRRLDRPGRGR